MKVIIPSILANVHTSLVAKATSCRPWNPTLFYHVALSEKSQYFIAKLKSETLTYGRLRDVNHLLPFLVSCVSKHDTVMFKSD